MQIKCTTLFLLLAGTTAFAQIKTNQNITTDPNSNAFLDASENTDGQSNNIGRGLLFPQTDLSTFTLDINATDGINYPTYFDGMIVYNTHEGDATTDPSLTTQTENLEKGFYYFSNPTGKATQSIANGKWIRISDAQANASLWEKQDNGNVKLVDADFLSNVEYKSYGGFRFSPKGYVATTSWNPGTWPPNSSDPVGYVSPKSEPYNTTFISFSGYASKIPYIIRTDTDPNYVTGTFKSNSLLVDPNATQHTRGYLALDNSLTVPPENTHDYSILYGVTNDSNHSGKGTIRNVMGAYNVGGIGSPDSKARIVRGSYNKAISYSLHPTYILEASFNSVTPKNTGSISNVHSNRNYASLADAFNSSITNFVMSRNDFQIEGGEKAPLGGTIDNLYGEYTTFSAAGNSAVTINKMYGIRLSNLVHGKTENYGLYIDNVGNGNAINSYAVYTKKGKSSLGDMLEVRNDEWIANQEAVFQFSNGFTTKGVPTSQIIDQMNGGGENGSNLIFKTQSPSSGTNPNITLPTEKLVIGADGKVKVNNLAGENTRMVVANADGVLSTQALPTPSAPKWVEDPSANAITLTVNSNGSPRVTNVVSVYDNGEVLASGFKGTNGSTIFPDYVFESYYTGTSTAKSGYKFANLSQVEDYVKANGYLPGYVSAKEIKAQGYIDIIDTQLTNVEKIEELYLHTIEQDKAIKAKDAKIAELETRLSKIEQLLNK